MTDKRIQQIIRIAAPVAVVLAGIVALAAVTYAAFAIGHLFIAYVALSPVESALAVLSSVGMAVGLLLVIITTTNQNARGLGAILLIAWVLLVLSMVALDSVMRAALVQAPAALQDIGRIVAALLPALALAACVCMAIALHDNTMHKSAAGASARYVSFAAKGVAIGASSFAAFYFGESRGIDPVLAVLCAALLESSFLWSYLALKNSRDRGDRFDVRMWSVCVFLFGAFITLVSIETLSTLGNIRVPIVAMFGEIGATLYVSAVGLTVALTVIVHLLTRAIDDVPGQPAGRPFAIRTADAIRKARAGMGEIRHALSGTPAPVDRQLPAGTTLASEHNQPAEGSQKRSETGVPYDTTGELVVSREEGEALMRAHREMLERGTKK